ncbi:MAG: hypothetical protein DHS20C18_22300 [Saprospiraceae bacterium]|nr:MAG: hypothetical protein DHS20C18_22300 [Saprospiraceae bacterium]
MFNQPNGQVWNLKGAAYSSLKDFFAAYAVKAQQYFINPAKETTLVSENGMRITFSPFSFSDQYGRIVTDEVQILLQEIHSWQELIFSGLVTGSGDRFLESAGPFNLSAYHKDGHLRLRQNFTVEFPVGNIPYNQPARLFRGSTSITRTLRGRKVFDWEEVSSKGLKIRRIKGEKYYHFELGSFNWWNCQYYYNKKANRAMVSVRLPINLDRVADKMAFLVVEDLNAVVMMYAHAYSFTALNIPTKLPARLLLLAYNEGQFYFHQQVIAETAKIMIDAQMMPVKESDILTALG